MPDQEDLPLLGGPSGLDAAAALGQGRTWTWREIHLASRAFEERLRGADAVCNLCDSRVGFLIAWVAALRLGCRVILPPSGGAIDIVRVLAGGGRVVVACDDAAGLHPRWRNAAAAVAEVRPHAPLPVAADRDLRMGPRWAEREVQLFTSGSTGAPVAQNRTLGQLVAGAKVLGARLQTEVEGGLGAIGCLICSVPPQHMFGLELSVMLTSVHGITVLDRRPLLPADVVEAFAQTRAALWVATPLHLRAMVRQGDKLANCAGVVTSTMPLAPSLAQRAETTVATPVLEIYGSTETGALAMRRTARSNAWQPLDGVSVESVEDGACASGWHFPSPRQIADCIEICGDGRFILQGRQTDLLKVGGRRASLAGLNLLLQDLPGIDDGCFYMPPDHGETARLCLIYSGEDQSLTELREQLRDRMDQAFLPRVAIQVERLPRTANGKLPTAALDRIYEQWRSGRTVPGPATFSVPHSHPSLPGHFPGRPIVPGVLLLHESLERVQRLTGTGVAAILQCKFSAAMLPGEVATVTAVPDASTLSAAFRVTTVRDGREVTLAAGRVALKRREDEAP